MEEIESPGAGDGSAKNVPEVPMSSPLVAAATATGMATPLKRSSMDTESENTWNGSNNGMIRHTLKVPTNDRPRFITQPENNGWYLNKPAAAVTRHIPVRLFPTYSFQPQSSPSGMRRTSAFGLRKRQSILYRQCFFNPISCFKK